MNNFSPIPKLPPTQNVNDIWKWIQRLIIWLNTEKVGDISLQTISYTKASTPPVRPDGQVIWITDDAITTNGVLAFSKGGNWYKVWDNSLIT